MTAAARPLIHDPVVKGTGRRSVTICYECDGRQTWQDRAARHIAKALAVPRHMVYGRLIAKGSRSHCNRVAHLHRVDA